MALSTTSNDTSHELRTRDGGTRLPAERRLHLFREMLRIRMAEEQIVHLYPEQEMRCPVHLSIGQEGPAVGVCAALRRDDSVVSTHRGHAHYLAKGGDLKAMYAEFYGKETGCARGRGGSMHLVDQDAGFELCAPIVGATVPVGVGLAFADWLQGRDRVTVVFFGDGTMEEGVVHEAMNWAVLKRLPCIFLCENNFYSVYTHLAERQPDRPIYTWAQGYGMPAAQGDGNDVAQVLAMTEEAVRRARSGGGPTFLEFITYRWREHCGPNYDNHIGYRTEAEFLEWKERDGLYRLQDQLFREGILDDRQIAAIARELQDEIDAAVRFAKESPFPAREGLMDYVYAA